ncbi:MAG: arginine repressor [Bacteroidaceae bacterium]|nr:arginine repressor [Bacteroidaceae bacterium]
MRKKTDRLKAIKLIISSREIRLQEDLMTELEKVGIKVTQATLSRDLKQLKVAKAANHDGNYVYVLPNEVVYKRQPHQKINEMLNASGLVSVDVVPNIAVIHTRPGYASGMAYDIDTKKPDGVLGTIAGDDTIMMITSKQLTKKKVMEILSMVFPKPEEEDNNND